MYVYLHSVGGVKGIEKQNETFCTKLLPSSSLRDWQRRAGGVRGKKRFLGLWTTQGSCGYRGMKMLTEKGAPNKGRKGKNYLASLSSSLPTRASSAEKHEKRCKCEVGSWKMGAHQYPDQIVKKTNKEENTTVTNFHLENHPFLLCSPDQSQCTGLLNRVLKEFT